MTIQVTVTTGDVGATILAMEKNEERNPIGDWTLVQRIGPGSSGNFTVTSTQDICVQEDKPA